MTKKEKSKIYEFAIGLLKDNPERIMSAFNYIVKNQ